MSKGFFKYDETTKREWFEVELVPGNPISRAGIQDYAAGMNMEPERWVFDGLVWWMHECDRQGAHGNFQARTKDYAPPREPVARWRVRLSEWLYGLADRINDTGER